MKKIIAVILALIMAMSCVACGGSKAEETTITFWAVPMLPEETFQMYADEFEAAHEGVNIELEYQTWEGIAEKLQLALSSGETPDVYIDGAARTASLPVLANLVPVDDVMNDLGKWYDAANAFGVKNGTHYLVPASLMGSSAFSVNMTLAKELGVDHLLPEDRMSWDINDFYAFCKACSEAGEEKGIKGTCLYAASATSDDIVYSILMSNGGQIIDKENNVCVANEAAIVEAVEVLRKIENDGYAVDGAEVLGDEDAMNLFLNQQTVVALNFGAPDALVQFETLRAEGYIEEVPEIRTYGVPTAEGVEMESACWGANGIAIFDNGDDAKAEMAKEFVKFLMGESTFSQDLWSAVPNYFPSRDNGEKITNENANIAEEVLFRQSLTASYANFEFGIMESYWPQVRNVFYPEMQAVYSGVKTAQEAMDSFAANVNEVLAAQKENN